MKKIILLISCLYLFSLTGFGQLNRSTEDSALVEVIVKDFKDKLRVHDRILFEGQKTKVVLQGMTNEAGTFRILLPEGDIYNIVIKGLGENQEYNTFSVPKVDGRYTMATLTLKYEPAKYFTLKNLTFESGKAIIKPGSDAILAELIELMQLKPELNIEIEGHTDDIGTDESNLSLSQARAEAVKKYVVTKGKIAASRIVAKGYGETKPIMENANEEGRQLNRRTVVRILNEDELTEKKDEKDALINIK